MESDSFKKPAHAPLEQGVIRPLSKGLRDLIFRKHRTLLAEGESRESTPEVAVQLNSLESILRDAADKLSNASESKVAPHQEKIPRWFKQHLAEATGGITTVALPIYAILETGPVGMSHLESLRTRSAAIVAAYAGLAFLYSRWRKDWMRMGHITEDSPLERRQIADFSYGGVFNFFVAPCLYAIPQWLQGEPVNLHVLGYSTVMATALGACAGSFIGPGMDIYRDLFGFRESKLVPQSLRKKSKRFKKLVATAFTAASLALTSIIYRTTLDNIDYVQACPLDPHEQARQKTKEKVVYERQPALPYRLIEYRYGVDLTLRGDVERLKEARYQRESALPAAPVPLPRLAPEN